MDQLPSRVAFALWRATMPEGKKLVGLILNQTLNLSLLHAGAEHKSSSYATLHKNLSFSFSRGDICNISASLGLLCGNMVHILLVHTEQ